MAWLAARCRTTVCQPKAANMLETCRYGARNCSAVKVMHLMTTPQHPQSSPQAFSQDGTCSHAKG